MSRGGKRPGAGRRRGSQNKRTKAALALAGKAAAEGSLPLEYMLQVMRDKKQPNERRDAMAIAAAPYIHPRRSAVSVSGNVNITHEDALKELE